MSTATTALTLEAQVTNLQADIKATLEQFYAQLPEMASLNSMALALLEQSKTITVFRRDQAGKIVVADGEAFVAATEQVKALKSVEEEIAELMDPFIDKLYKAHRASTAIRAGYTAPVQAEIKRLKLEREQYAAEEDRKARAVAQAAAEAARQAEEARLIEEARVAASQGDSVAAEAILEEAVNVEAPPAVVQSTVPKISGTSFRAQWNWELKDFTKLKPEFVKVDDVAIGKVVRSMRKSAETVVGEPGAIRVWDSQIIVG
jgi:hypothetical protein